MSKDGFQSLSKTSESFKQSLDSKDECVSCYYNAVTFDEQRAPEFRCSFGALGSGRYSFTSLVFVKN